MTASTATSESPASTTIRIRPRRGWVGLDYRELWAHRELLYFLIWRDLKVRYRQTFFGVAWALLRPILPMVIFTLLLGRLTGIAPVGVSYPLFVLAALVPWTFFAQSVTGASGSLVGASNLIQKVYFPRLLLPLGVVGASLVDLGIMVSVLLVLTLVVGGSLPLTVLWLIPLTLLGVLISLSFGVWLSAVNVRFRDVGHAVPFLVQLLLFLTPVFYSPDLVPAAWRAVYDLNPMAGLVAGFRWAVLGLGDPPIAALALSAATAAILLIAGVVYFRRVERTFADVI
jgi:ABC-type polysaccharide/polyol phosphate export systems, permease component